MAFSMVQDTARSVWTRASTDRPREIDVEKLGSVEGADLNVVPLRPLAHAT